MTNDLTDENLDDLIRRLDAFLSVSPVPDERFPELIRFPIETLLRMVSWLKVLRDRTRGNSLTNVATSQPPTDWDVYTQKPHYVDTVDVKNLFKALSNPPTETSD